MDSRRYWQVFEWIQGIRPEWDDDQVHAKTEEYINRNEQEGGGTPSDSKPNEL